MGSQVTMKGLLGTDRQVPAEPDDQGVHRRRPRGHAGLRRGRHGRRRRQRTARLLQGPGEVGQDVPGHRRRALLVPWRLRQGRRRRIDHPARTRQPGDQQRRREDLSRRRSRKPSSGSPASRTASWSAIEDEKFGQAVTAVASRIDGSDVDAATVIATVKHELAGYKAPKSVVFVAGSCLVPRTARPTTSRQATGRSRDGVTLAARRESLPVEELRAEELDDPLDAGVVAMFGQHRVIGLLRCSAARWR